MVDAESESDIEEGLDNPQTSQTAIFRRGAVILQTLMVSADQLQGTFAVLYAVGRGSTGLIQGAIVSIRELGTAILQPLWGSLSDIRGRRQFVSLGFLIQALSWGILMPLTRSPLAILMVFVFQSLLGTMVIPTWNGWLGDFTQKLTRGRFLGRIGIITTWLSTIALFSVSVYMQLLDPMRVYVSTYSIAFRVGGVFYLLAAISSFFIPQADRFLNQTYHRRTPKKPVLLRLRSAIKQLHPDFKQFLIVEAIFRVAWAAAWPIFPYATLSATSGWIQIAVLQMVTAFASGLSQLVGGSLADRFGRKPVILISRSVLISPPLLYGFGVIYQLPSLLMISNILVGIMLGASAIATNSLILDIAPDGKESSYFSIYMLTVGLVSFFASLIMGLILNIIMPSKAPSSDLIAILLFVIAAMRFLSWFVYFFLPETIQRNQIDSREQS